MTKKTKHKKRVMHITTPPTTESYGELTKVYAFFNKALFDGTLPPCLLTFRRHRKAYGYFSPKRFERQGGGVTDEIALDPNEHRTDEQLLSTIVHEMCHLRQHHFGKATRNGYHNKEWARMMDEVGLTPSSTGEPGGKRTGQRVTHFIVDGGPFSRACEKLLASGVRITWRSVDGPEKEGKSGRRTKFTCPDCGQNAWGKDDLEVDCRTCEQPMESESPQRNVMHITPHVRTGALKH